ncbi:MAG: DNA repair protein RecN [Alphaproteobacteria bacterium]|nr:DNA repair protein RecN [Alphaproteobacteria bacterium]
MIDSLSIRNVVLIDKLDLTFEKGLGVFTGETGAGKSILLDSLSLLLGARADSSLVRYGENQLSVAAEFSAVAPEVISFLSEQGIECEDGNILIRRVVTKEGKSKSFINDQNVSVSFLKTIGENLVEIHGQFSTHSLLNPSTHLFVLDTFGKLTAETTKTKELWHQYQKAIKETKSARERIENALKQKEYLEQSLEDLENLNPLVAEEESLVQKRTNLMNSEKILSSTGVAYQLLSDEQNGIERQLAIATRHLEKASQYDEKSFTEIIEILDQTQNLLSEAEYRLEQITENFGDTSELPIIDDRLFALRAAARRHQTTIDDLPNLIQRLKQDLLNIDKADDTLKEFEAHEQALLKEFICQAEKLSEKRKKAADQLDAKVKTELPDLKLGKAVFKTIVEKKELSEATETGLDTVTFTVSTNTGTPLAPLNKIASGGELSRFMLALKVNLAKQSALPTIVFDEIDSGVGGSTADAIGSRLNKLAADCQVIAVTHAPQVASYGLQHWTVSKSEKNGKIITSVQKLNSEERLKEIARMLSGDKITQTGLDMAKELLFKQTTLL